MGEPAPPLLQEAPQTAPRLLHPQSVSFNSQPLVWGRGLGVALGSPSTWQTGKLGRVAWQHSKVLAGPGKLEAGGDEAELWARLLLSEGIPVPSHLETHRRAKKASEDKPLLPHVQP